MAADLRKRTLGEQIGLSFSLSALHFGPLFVVTLLFTLPGDLAYTALAPSEVQNMNFAASTAQLLEMMDRLLTALTVYGAISLVAFPLQTAACTSLAGAPFLGRRPTIGTALRDAFRVYFPMLFLQLGLTLIYFFGALPFLIPLMFFIAWFYVAAPVVVFERVGWLVALQRSRKLAQGYYLEAFAMFWTMVLVSAFGAAFLVLPAVFLLGEQHPYALHAISVLCATIIALPVTVAPVVTYFHLRVVKEAYDVQRLAEFVEVIAERGLAGKAG